MILVVRIFQIKTENGTKNERAKLYVSRNSLHHSSRLAQNSGFYELFFDDTFECQPTLQFTKQGN